MPESFYTHCLEINGTELGHVIEFYGREALSDLFEFEITVRVHEPIDQAGMLGAPASFRMSPAHDGASRDVKGRVWRTELVEVQKSAILYRISIGPSAFALTQRAVSRIFQDKTAPEVIASVLDGAGVGYRLALRATYAVREFCVQYRETDWNFVCRLMEEEGILYFFDTDEEGTMVLGDSTTVHVPIAGHSELSYRAREAGVRGLDFGLHVSQFSPSSEVRSGKFTLRDWDFMKPALLLEQTSSGASQTDWEVYDYPAGYNSQTRKSDWGGVRLEEASSQRTRAVAESTCVRLCPGFRFSVTEHPIDAMNREYVVTQITHRGVQRFEDEIQDEQSQEPVYENHFEVLPSDVLFRPARSARRAVVHGSQTAIVVGPAGEEVHVDEHGRVKVQFHWDRLGKRDDKSSCWVRVSQIWAGEGWGAMFLPRIGQEVVVTFLEGNPDRPLIVGRVYHATNVPPYALPAEKTKSTIKSNSSPGGEGFNEVRFEDKKGSEELYFHAAKDLLSVTENDASYKVVHDETHAVGHDRVSTIDNDRTDTIGRDHVIAVKQDRTTTVTRDDTVKVERDHTMEVTRDRTETIGRDHVIAVTGAQKLSVDGDRTHVVKGDQSIEVAGAHRLTVDGTWTADVAKTVKLHCSDKVTVKIDGDLTLECGAAKVTVTSSGDVKVEGANLTVQATGSVKVDAASAAVTAKGSAKVSGATVLVEGQGMAELKATGMVKVSGAAVSLG